MPENESATAFHCTRCNNISQRRTWLSDSASSRRLDIYDCPNCGKIDPRLFDEPSGEAGIDPPEESADR